jgi:chaperonin GroEL
LEFAEGVQWDYGYLSPYMVTDSARSEAVLEDALILLTDQTISQVQLLMPVLEQVTRTERPLVIVAENVDGPALGMLVTNAMHGTFRSVAVRAPGFGHRRLGNLQDLAALTGGQVVSKQGGMKLEATTVERLGRARRVIVTDTDTTIVGGAGSEEDVRARIVQLKSELNRAQNPHDRDHLQERLAKLAGRVAVITVGAATEVELKEKQRRTDGALAATRAAVEEGILAGGGAALFFLVAIIISRNSVGMGDVKLVLLIGVVLGSDLVVALFVTGVAGAVVAIVLISRSGLAARKQHIPFAPLLAVGAVVALLIGDPAIYS